MKIVNYLLFENRSGIYAFVFGNSNEALVLYKKLSDPTTWFVIRTGKGNLTQNFLNAAGATDDITPLDVLSIALRLGISIPDSTIRKMVKSSQLIRELAKQMAIT